MTHDYIDIQFIITYVPKGDFWKSGLLTRSYRLKLPIETLDLDKLTQFIYTNFKEIQNVVQTENETN